MSGLAYILLGQSPFFSGVNLQRRLRVPFDLQFLANAMRTPFPIRNRNRIDGSELVSLSEYWVYLASAQTIANNGIYEKSDRNVGIFPVDRVYLSSSGVVACFVRSPEEENIPDQTRRASRYCGVESMGEEIKSNCRPWR
ncbi:hypothetical protein LINGRAHAP2_LOCUS12653 [Linum grandiflorum]